jgi:hypothetical protein
MPVANRSDCGAVTNKQTNKQNKKKHKQNKGTKQ